MKRLAIVYGTDRAYIREVLAFFQLREVQRGGDRRYIAVAWGAAGEFGQAWSVNGRFEVEAEISDRPPLFEEAVILSLPASAERSLHKKISDLLLKGDVSQFNPYSSSRMAGDKYLTIRRLAAKNIPVPEAVLLGRADASGIIARLRAFLDRHEAAGLFVQPNEGTEGREAYFFSADDLRRSSDLAAAAVSGILRDRDVIVKQARGNVFYFNKEEAERGHRPVTFRVFLWQPDKVVEADLGFAEVSPSAGDPVTSPERGGRIIPPSEALAGLFYRGPEGFHRLVLSEEEARSLPAIAVRALAAFNSGLRKRLRIAGVDLLLEVTGGRVRPIVLEINPRPSGLDKLAPFERRRSGGLA